MPGPAATRPSNKNKHTALEAQKVTQSRRPTQEVQAEKRAKEQEKIQKEGKKKAGQIEAARLEQEAREKANALKAKVSGADRLNIPRVRQQRPGASGDSGNQVEVYPDNVFEAKVSGADRLNIPRVRQQRPGASGDSVPGNQVEVYPDNVFDDDEAGEWAADPKSDSNEPQEIIESDLSGSEYQKSVTESESDEDEDEPELEVDEPDTAIAQKKKKGKEKKVKPGVLFREEVRLMRDVNDGGSQKRKAPSESHRSSASKKTKQAIPTGVYSNWSARDTVLLPQPVPHQRAASASSFSSKTNSRATSSDKDTPDFSPSEDSSGFQEGGLGSDGDEVERELTINQPSIAKGFRFRSIAKIEPISDGPIIRKLTKRVTFEDIPREAAQQFDYIKVILFDTAGKGDAWVALTNEQLASIWNLLLQEKYPVSTNRRDGDAFTLFLDVKKLMNRSVSNWIHRIGEGAVKALEEEYELRDLGTKEARARFVGQVLGEQNQLHKRRPFLWQTTDDHCWFPDPFLENKANEFQGLFLGRMVLRTLAEHFMLISAADVDDIHTLSEKPCGALIYAVQAVHRALLFSVTGEFKKPGGRESHFSFANWGDISSETVGADGKRIRKVTKRASIFKATIANLPDRHWVAIVEGAKEYLGRNTVVEGRQKDAVVVEESDDEDEVLRDPMFAD